MKRILKNCNVLDGSLNMKLLENVDILIENNKIAKISKSINVKADKIIDLKGTYVIPGLINMHVHLPASGKVGKKKVADQKALVDFICKTHLTRRIGVAICAKYAKMELLSGVTTLRAVGGISSFDSTLRNEINKGRRVGPRILSCDNAIGVQGGHMDGTVANACSNETEAIQMVLDHKKHNADWIKLMITGGVLDSKTIGHPGDLKMKPEMVKAVCDKAHELGLKVAAHVESPEGVKVAIENGVDTIEHGGEVTPELVEMLKSRKGALICTLSPAMPFCYMPPEVTGYGDKAKINSTVLLKGMVQMNNMCLENGVSVGLGTDTGCPFVTHYDMWRELVYFTKFVKGVNNSFALHSATEVNATILGMQDKIGTVKEGKLADLMIVKDNPLNDLLTLKEPLMVIKDGRIYRGKNKKYPKVDAELDKIM